MISVANAPISYGAFELTVGIYPNVPDGVGVLDRVKEAGYSGVDLGPIGYLGLGDEISENLRSRGLGLTGGYLELPFHDPEGMPAALVELGSLIDVFDVTAPVNAELGLPAPRPTIAVVSLPYRRDVPGRAVNEPELGYTEDQWGTFAVQAEVAAKLCRDRGYSPVFHNETGTNVEAPWEIEKVLELTSYDLCLDTGHLIACGGDPVAGLRKWSSRVTHIHVKSAYRSRMQELIDGNGDVEMIWSKRIFAPLGEGDLDLPALAGVVREIGYNGWIVVEQDIFPGESSLSGAEQDQRNNRQVLRDLGF